MDDYLLRLVFAIVVGMLAGQQLTARYFASCQKKDQCLDEPRRSLGEFFVFTTTILWALSLLVYPTKYFGYHLDLHIAVRWVGIPMMIACIPLFAWTHLSLGIYFSSKLQLLSRHEIVKIGPYKYVRHPMYSTLFLCAIGASLASADLIVSVLSFILIVVVSGRVGREECMMLERFPREYASYRYYVGAFFPKII